MQYVHKIMKAPYVKIVIDPILDPIDAGILCPVGLKKQIISGRTCTLETSVLI